MMTTTNTEPTDAELDAAFAADCLAVIARAEAELATVDARSDAARTLRARIAMQRSYLASI